MLNYRMFAKLLLLCTWQLVNEVSTKHIVPCLDCGGKVSLSDDHGSFISLRSLAKILFAHHPTTINIFREYGSFPSYPTMSVGGESQDISSWRGEHATTHLREEPWAKSQNEMQERGIQAFPNRLWRRDVVSSATSVGLALALPSHAKTRGGVQWGIDLPESFRVTKQLESIVRVKTETMLLGEDESIGAQVKLLLLPFGQQAGSSFNADEQLLLSSFFLKGGAIDTLAAEAVSKTLVSSISKSPTVMNLSPLGATKAYSDENGRKYVQCEYVVEKCSTEVYDGSCEGTRKKRHTVAIATMSSLAQWRTNTERERMREAGVVRNVEVLWLLTLSASDAADWGTVAPILQQAGASFYVPVSETL